MLFRCFQLISEDAHPRTAGRFASSPTRPYPEGTKGFLIFISVYTPTERRRGLTSNYILATSPGLLLQRLTLVLELTNVIVSILAEAPEFIPRVQRTLCAFDSFLERNIEIALATNSCQPYGSEQRHIMHHFSFGWWNQSTRRADSFCQPNYCKDCQPNYCKEHLFRSFELTSEDAHPRTAGRFASSPTRPYPEGTKGFLIFISVYTPTERRRGLTSNYILATSPGLLLQRLTLVLELTNVIVSILAEAPEFIPRVQRTLCAFDSFLERNIEIALATNSCQP